MGELRKLLFHKILPSVSSLRPPPPGEVGYSIYAPSSIFIASPWTEPYSESSRYIDNSAFVNTMIRMRLPEGCFALITAPPYTGMPGLSVQTQVITDSDYPIYITLHNVGTNHLHINHGDIIAKMIILSSPILDNIGITLIEVDTSDELYNPPKYNQDETY